MRFALCVPFGLLAAASFGADYVFTPGAETGRVKISLAKNTSATEFWMPAWLPGDYQIFDYGKVISDVAFTKKGVSVASEHSDERPNVWIIPKGADAVSYTVKPSRGNFSPNLQIRGELVFINGGGVFGYFEDHRDEAHTLKLDTPAGLTGFSALAGKDKNYTAPDYDLLIDSPIVMGPTGSIRVAEKTLHGKAHRVLAFGDNSRLDVDGFLKVGCAAADQAFKLFGELPYDRYTFFLDVGGPGGGLEHLNGTRIGLGRGSTPEGAVGIMFHEYFHAFNVKRIRARALGPFDYTKPAMTSTIWWLEGVTDYYASVLAARAGYSEPLGAMREVYRAAMSVSRGKYLEISAEEASKRVWETRGSFGFGGVSYYSRGHALGFYLDMAIRSATSERRSLDDVMRKLYQECKNGPGYSDDRIRQLVMQFGGEALGPVYDKSVKEATALDFTPFFQKFGITVADGQISGRGLSNWPAAPAGV